MGFNLATFPIPQFVKTLFGKQLLPLTSGEVMRPHKKEKKGKK